MILVEMTSVGWIVPSIFNCSVIAVGKLHLWTLFLTTFYSMMLSGGMAFLFGLMTVYMMMMGFPSREKEMGSTSFLLWVLIMTACINIVNVSINWVLVHTYY